VGFVYVLLAGYLAAAGSAHLTQLGLVVLGSFFGHGLILGSPWYASDDETRIAIYGLLMVGMGVLGTVGVKKGAPACAIRARWHGALSHRVCSDSASHGAPGRVGTGLEAPTPKIVTNLAEELTSASDRPWRCWA
jgi:hypothetical protein